MAMDFSEHTIRPIQRMCTLDGCGFEAMSSRANPDDSSSARFNALMQQYFGKTGQSAMEACYAANKSRVSLIENLQVHAALAIYDESVPSRLHETGVFLPWTPGPYPKIKNLCKKKCCTHQFLEPLGRKGLGGVGCLTANLWMSRHEGCTAMADSIRVGKKPPMKRGIRLIDISIRLGYLVAQKKKEKVAALVKSCMGKTLILTPNLNRCTIKLQNLLMSLQAAFLAEIMRGRGPKFGLPTSIEHDFADAPGVNRHIRCVHPENAEDALGNTCTCVVRGILKPKRVVTSGSRHDTTEDYETYGAVSYVWTECGPEEVHQLLEDKGLKDAICSDAAICAAGHPNIMRRKLDGVWIDQQCINQADPEEKAEEIRNMRAYYENANVVFVILPSMVLSDPLIGLTHECLLDLQSEEMGMKNLSEQWDKQMWRTRVWTYQEGTANIKTIAVCNNGHIQLSMLEAIILAWKSGVRYFKGSIWEPTCSSFLGNMAALTWASDFELSSVTRQLLVDQGPGTPGLYGRRLRDIIPVMQNRDCSIALDRVYGVLGLACDGNKVKIDYSMSEEELMLHIGQEGLLSIETLLASSINDMPGYSWMPKSMRDLPRSVTRYGNSAITLRVDEDKGCWFMGTEDFLVVQREGTECRDGCIWKGMGGAHEEGDTRCKLSVLLCFGIPRSVKKSKRDGEKIEPRVEILERFVTAKKTDGEEIEYRVEIPGRFIIPGKRTALRRWQRTGPALWESHEWPADELKGYLLQGIEHWIVG